MFKRFVKIILLMSVVAGRDQILSVLREFLYRPSVRARTHVTSLMGLAPPDWGGEFLLQATEGEEED